MNPSDTGPRKALGRGLAALIPDTAGRPGDVRKLPIETIRPNPDQPRKQFDPTSIEELAASIREQGVLQPIIVRKRDRGYEIVTGERRWRATSHAGLHEIPALIRDCSDEQALQLALVENIQREDLDPLEEAQAFSQLIREHNLTQEQIGQAVGRSRAAITNSLRLLRLPQAVLDFLAAGKLTPGHARAIMTLKSDDDMCRLATEVIKRGASVRDTEQKARMLIRSQKRAQTARKPKTPNDASLEERLMRALQTKVRLHHRKGQGRLEIFFHSYEQLDAILEKIDP